MDDSAEELAGAVADAINNPLAALIGTVEMALESPRGSRKALERVRYLARRIESVVEGVLALFRSRERRDVRVDLAALLESCAHEAAEHALAERVTIETKSEANLPRISADPALLSLALLAIAENALAAMAGEGHLWLDAEAIPSRGIVQLRVSDTGPGIPESLRERALEPFFSTRSGRAGLGLAIAASVAREHAGRLVIAERAGGGARLTMELPLG